MYRTQILLEPDLHDTLVEIARTEKRSLSDLVREMLVRQLEVRKKRNLEIAARELLADYQVDPELTSFTSLDSDDFYVQG